MFRIKQAALLFVTVALTSSMASGAFIVTPTSANASSAKNPTSTATQTIDGSGLYTDATKTTPDNSITGIHFADPGNNTTNSNWSWVWGDGSGDPLISGEWIEFDLGQEYDLTGAYIWQTTFSTTGRQLRTFDIDTSTDDVTYSNVLSDVQLPQVTTLADGSTATYFDFGTTVTARYVRIEVDGTYERSAGDRNWLGGIGEAKFEAVPEPASLALLGLGGLLIARRK